MNQFCAENYEITLRVHCINDETTFLKNYGDLCISTFLEGREDIIQTYLMTFHVGLYASPEYLEKHNTPRHITDLVHHRLMSYDRGIMHQYGSHINEIFQQNHAYNQGCFIEMNSGQSLVYLASKGHGIIALSQEYPGLKDANLVRVLPSIENNVDIYISFPVHKKNKRSVHIFSQYLQNALRSQHKVEKKNNNNDKTHDSKSGQSALI